MTGQMSEDSFVMINGFVDLSHRPLQTASMAPRPSPPDQKELEKRFTKVLVRIILFRNIDE